MSATRDVDGPVSRPESGRRSGQVDGDAGPSMPARGPAEERLIRLMEEFRDRQRRCPNLVVRPWWTAREEAGGGAGRMTMGFVVEYCPAGVDSAELAVRRDRVRVEGPGGVLDGALDLAEGWLLDGRDRACPETMANYLLRMADEVLENAAA